MSFQTEREVTSELEPKPKVLVEFYGWSHHPLNLQGRQRMKDAFVKFLQSQPGKSFIVLESADLSQSAAENLNKYTRKFESFVNGFWATAIRQNSNEVPPVEQILAMRRLFPSDNLQEIFETSPQFLVGMEFYLNFSKI